MNAISMKFSVYNFARCPRNICNSLYTTVNQTLSKASHHKIGHSAKYSQNCWNCQQLRMCSKSNLPLHSSSSSSTYTNTHLISWGKQDACKMYWFLPKWRWLSIIIISLHLKSKAFIYKANANVLKSLKVLVCLLHD